ncbi:hypothetical protein Y032_0006g3098 [Ancylostoma ceylanicum]|uniref:Reverse transcriptase domain-containing protein n=1 Tax=Ancylostoma ceylanicum TaxID=53326 RepID=A0A016VQQ6_9BILA|nr:hypothetical protein Y032_0006g3098 [Ancylostoma ceylanicum]
MYADDIKIYGIYSRENSNQVRSALQASLANLAEWASNWNVTINFNKSSILHLGPGSTIDYAVNGLVLKSCSTTKDLGVVVDNTLKFSKHVDHCVGKAYSTLFLLLRNIRSNNPRLLTRLFKAFVIPHLEYCSQVWNPFLKRDVDKIERVQKTFTRLLFKRLSPYGAIPCYHDRLQKLNMKSLCERRALADLVFGFKVLRKEMKLRASKYWLFKPTSVRTGGFNLYYAKIQQKSFLCMFNNVFYRLARWFQLLPQDALKAQNGKAFREKLKQLDLSRLLNIACY